MVAVAAPEGDLDEGVPWHYGDPMVEQRELATGRAAVDLSHLGVVRVSGPRSIDVAAQFDVSTSRRASARTFEPCPHLESTWSRRIRTRTHRRGSLNVDHLQPEIIT